MLNEIQEFRDYTLPPVYDSKNILGRFTMESILDFLGLDRILTILARGYLYSSSDHYDNIALAKQALCAWCSVPNTEEKAWEGSFSTCFPELHAQFPELVDENGVGWYVRHIRSIVRFAEDNPRLVKASVRKYVPKLKEGFESQWRKRVRQFQIPIFHDDTDALWQIRFDDIIANALELGPLREMEATVTPRQEEKLRPFVQGDVKLEHLITLIAYYMANKPEDSDWVVLPSSNFNNYFGSTVFTKKVLPQVTGNVIARSPMSYGTARYLVLGEFL